MAGKKDVLHQLKEMGTAQNRKIYGRHGVGKNMYGVNMANLKSFKKQLKVNQPLAQSLWETGNHDARMLATMIADPRQTDSDTLEKWGQDLDNYVITDAFSGLVNRSPSAQEKMKAWTNSESEWLGQAGWNILAHLAMQDKTLPNEFFQPWLNIIEADIHHRKNRVRYSMNNALIAIGIRNIDLEKEAVDVACKIGKVKVDHGRTSCKTPDAVEYIQRTLAHRLK